MKKLILATILLTISVLSVNAQRYFGIATSNWSGTAGMYLNPANIADSRAKFSIDLFSMNFGVDNDLGKVSLSSFFSAFSGSNSKLDAAFTSYSSKPNFSLLLPYMEMRLPGAMVSLDHKSSIAISPRIRIINQFNNFSQNIFHTAIDSTFSPNQDYSLNSKNFNWTMQAWAEMNVTYARILYENDAHMLKAGVTLRYMIGLAYISIKGNNLDATFYHTNDSLAVKNTDVEYASNIPDSLGSNLSDIFSQFGKQTGHGFGADFGVVYEYRPDFKDYIVDAKNNILDPSSNKYKIRLSLSVTDIGSITYNNNLTGTASGNGSISSGVLIKDFLSIHSFKDYASSRGFNFDTSVGTVKVHMPTALVAAADYYIGYHFYVNATYIGNLVNRQDIGNSYYNQITITPRFDTKFYSLGLPITYSSLSGAIKAGFGMRMGGFFIGSDDVLAFVSNASGVNFYAGLSVPINKKAIKSKDAGPAPDAPVIGK